MRAVDTICVKVLGVRKNTTWQVCCDACGAWNDPKGIRTLSIGQVSVELCAKCWEPLAA